MPIAQVYLVEGRDAEAKRKVIEKVTAALSEALGSDPQAVRVLVHDVPSGAWGRGGTPMSDSRPGAPAEPEAAGARSTGNPRTA